MQFRIRSVDHEPDDLAKQLPIRGRLLRQIPGKDRPDYWLAELGFPLAWTKDGVTRTIRHLVLKARWKGTAIGPGAHIPVGIFVCHRRFAARVRVVRTRPGRVRRDRHDQGVEGIVVVETSDEAVRRQDYGEIAEFAMTTRIAR